MLVMTPGFEVKPVAVPPEKLWKQFEFDNDFDLAFRIYAYPDDLFSVAGLIDPSTLPGRGSLNFMSYQPSEAFAGVLADCQDRRDFGTLREAMLRMHADFVEEMPFKRFVRPAAAESNAHHFAYPFALLVGGRFHHDPFSPPLAAAARRR
jgi:hypothetical protein